MLGRQQIAGIPTAVHELFKNAHDAYAKRVEVDFFRKQKLLILRDDGYGMPRHELEDRWLTLGTESKVDANADETPWPSLLGMPRRQVMGEKGIGRLAIAVIGPQVLVVTRAMTEDGLSPPAVCFVNWRLFEVPALDLDEVEVPVIELPHGGYPDRQVVRKLAAAVKRNVNQLGDRLPSHDRDTIINELDLVDFDPAHFLNYLNETTTERSSPDLRDGGHGTHFFILPTYQTLEDDIDEEGDDAATPLKKNLLGFSNTMMPRGSEPPLKTLFRDHLRDGRVHELIARDNFLLPSEFTSADHHFDGEFDAFGQFKGTVQVYGEPAIEYTLPWAAAGGQETECGPFRVSVAYVQGRADETRLPHEDWVRLCAKLDKIGGLYIYRDGIRILPYGNSDYDFLNIERRRTKAAKDWFFSYRRMFGAVEISFAHNPALQEKAGREGFRANTAYRQFRAILENFFMRLALDFFRKTADRGEDYRRVKDELKERVRLLKKKDALAREKKRKFIANLETFFESVESGIPSRQAQELRREFFTRLDAIENLEDPGLVGSELIKLEQEFSQRVAKLEQQYSVERPRGAGMSKQLATDWRAYQKNASRLDETVYAPLRSVIDEAIQGVIAAGNASVDRRKRLDSLLDELKSEHLAGAKRLSSSASQSLTNLNSAVKNSINETTRRLRDGIASSLSDLQSTDVAKLSEAAFEQYRKSLLRRIDELGESERRKLARLRDQLDSVADAVREGESIVEMADAAEDDSIFAREELATYTEFAQTGMALGIIQHEFGSTVQSVRDAIRRLKPWADGTPELAGVHQDLRASFEHLDGYLTLFTPLSRRLYRSTVLLTGEEIRRYIEEIFSERLLRHNIKLSATKQFDSFALECYPSTFLPVFINLVDNAIYWIGFDRDSERWIKLDSDGIGFTVSNGGPGIEAKDADRIFDFGESNKIGGRGMGLFISRQGLKREGWNITLDAVGRDMPPVFRIAPIEDQIGEVEEVE